MGIGCCAAAGVPITGGLLTSGGELYGCVP